MTNDGALYIALADSAMYRTRQSRDPRLRENAYALRYYTAALQLVNQQITRATTFVYDAVIGTVAGLASYDVGL